MKIFMRNTIIKVLNTFLKVSLNYALKVQYKSFNNQNPFTPDALLKVFHNLFILVFTSYIFYIKRTF